MLRDLGGWHLLIILGIVVLLFGSTKLPGLAKGVAQSMRIFKSEIKEPTAPAAAASNGAPAPAAGTTAPTVAEPTVAPVATPTVPPHQQ